MIEPKVKINFITKRIGHSFYDQSVLDVIPNSYAPLPILKNKTLMLRLDYGFNENAFFQYCKSHECALILRNNVIQIAHLEPLARNIRKIIILSIKIILKLF